MIATLRDRVPLRPVLRAEALRVAELATHRVSAPGGAGAFAGLSRAAVVSPLPPPSSCPFVVSRLSTFSDRVATLQRSTLNGKASSSGSRDMR